MEVVETESRKLNALIGSVSPDGVLGNVQELEVICVDYESMTNLERATIKSNLLDLPAALPQDSLSKFSSDTFKLDRNVLGLLLRMQTKLKELVVCIDERAQNGLPGPA